MELIVLIGLIGFAVLIVSLLQKIYSKLTQIEQWHELRYRQTEGMMLELDLSEIRSSTKQLLSIAKDLDIRFNPRPSIYDEIP